LILQYIPKKKFLLFAGDIVAIAVAYLLAPTVRFGVFVFEPTLLWQEVIAILLIYLFCFYSADLYNLETKFITSRYIYRFLSAIAASTGITLIVSFFIPNLKLGRGVFAINAGLILLFTFFWHLLFELLFKKIIKRQKNVLIVGAGKAGNAIYRLIKDDPAIKVIGFVDDDQKKNKNHNYPNVLGDHSVIDEIIKNENIDRIIIAIKDIKNAELFSQLIKCKMKGIQIFDIPTFYEQMLGKIYVEHVTDSWFLSIYIAGVKRSIYNLNIKRFIGIVLSLFSLLVGLPIIIVSALLIKLDSKGPIFYKQDRVGLDGRIFRLVKLRSMTVDAEANGAVWAKKEDPRVTRVGRIIRKLRIDEIPQMWNVLKGDMNFFGPRPERPEFVEMLKEKIPYYDLRHAVKPGITGWAQVNYPYGASVEDALEKLKYDLFYIKNLSPFLDFHILLRTVRVVLFGKGAR